MESNMHYWRGGAYVDGCTVYENGIKIGDTPMMQWAIQAMDPFQTVPVKYDTETFRHGSMFRP